MAPDPGIALATPAGMSEAQTQIWNDVKRVRDELALKIHLAGMDARDRWNELQPRIAQLENTIERGGDRAGKVVADQLAALGKALRSLRDEVSHMLDEPRPPT
ncbi:MAG: hypothetical protein H6Q90_4903 [Deltaproteobacteria bacterium]|nr:hypothetical protein [Deltaproteobacteria bacterium]